MIKYCIKRLLLSIPVIIGISLLAFILGVLSPGDPAEMALSREGLEAPTEIQLNQMRQELGLDKPLYLQYAVWLGRLCQGDLGTSYITGQAISDELARRFPITFSLAVFALLLAAMTGLLLGVLSACFKGKTLDKVLTAVSGVMLSVPGFWLGLLLILLFGETLKILPTSGSESFRHFILPAFVLSFSTMGVLCRYMRGAIVGEMGKHHYLVARTRGIGKMKLLLFYALPNAVIPVIALLGNYFAAVLGGSVIIESIFAIPGIGTMAIEAIHMRDYPVIQAYVLVCGVILVLTMLLVDIFIAYVNPRIRLGDEHV